MVRRYAFKVVMHIGYEIPGAYSGQWRFGPYFSVTKLLIM